MNTEKPNNIDEYIDAFPANVQAMLTQMRQIIKSAAPDAIETLSYGMPAFKLTKIVAWFAAHKKHIGFYPSASPIVYFKADLKDYQTSKGAIQFPFDKALPVDLITAIIHFRVNEIQSKIKTKK